MALRWLAVNWELVERVALFLFIDDFCDGLEYFIVVRPLICQEFGADEYIVYIDFEGADPGVYNLLASFFIEEQILIIFDLWGFY